MPTYSFTARDQRGKNIKGERTYSSEQELARALREDGLILTHWERKQAGRGNFFKYLSSLGGASIKEKILFTNNLAMMLKAGVSVTKGVGILSQQAKSSSFKKILRQVQEDLQKGKTFADSLDVFPHVFPEMFTSMVRVGELSGRLEEVMKNLSLQLQKDHQLIARIRGAMTYPTIVLLAMIGVGIVMMTMVLPQLSDIFRDIDAELPITTRTLMAVGDFTGDNVILVLAGALVAVILFIVFMKFRLTKPLWHQILLFFPLIGGVVKKVNLARFARTVSSLLKSGVSMVTALEIVSKTLGNVHFRKATGAAGKEIVKGVSLVSVFEKNPRLFPPMVTQMIAIGEETGELDAILLQLAGFYEEEAKETTENLSSIIEPLLMIIMGVAVGFLAMAIIQPIYSIGSSM